MQENIKESPKQRFEEAASTSGKGLFKQLRDGDHGRSVTAEVDRRSNCQGGAVSSKERSFGKAGRMARTIRGGRRRERNYMEELKKERLKISNKKGEFAHEVREVRENKRMEEESSCERHNKRKEDDRVNMEPPPSSAESCCISSRSVIPFGPPLYEMETNEEEETIPEWGCQWSCLSFFSSDSCFFLSCRRFFTSVS